MRAFSRWILVAAAVVAVSGCDQTRKVLGMDKRAPDEFTVYSRAPLSLPPNYDLRPPTPGESRPQDAAPTDMAERILRGNRNAPLQAAPAGSSAGVQSLLKETGALMALPDIRATVNRETTTIAEENKRVTDKIIFWRKPDQPGTVVDAEKEAQRIRENQALGKPVTEGDTPTIQRRKRGLF